MQKAKIGEFIIDLRLIFALIQHSMNAIPYYTEINEFLASISVEQRTSNFLFYCLRLKEHKGDIYKPPFRRGFYFLALFTEAGNTKVVHGTTNESDLNSFLVFQSPELIYSFYRDSAAHGYLIYFKPECFSFFKPDFNKAFPLFDLLHTNLFKFDHTYFQKLAPHFEEVFTTYERTSKDQHLEARIRLLALLCHLNEFTAERRKEIRLATPQQILLRKFVQLVNNHYIDKRTVQEYADLLAVTPNYLSQSIKAVTGKNALSYISERLTIEAKSLIRHTDFEIAEIAYQLNFSDPANFGRFFRKQEGMSPLEFRKLSKP